jgi:phage recombination protein Bet
MTTDIDIQQPSTLLAISSGQDWFTQKQLAALNHMGVEDAPQGDLAVFLHQCQRTGLDPFAKQIYMIGRKSKGEVKWTIQTGIDGYRVLGDRVAERRGDVIEHDEPLWADDEGVWHDVWTWGNAPTAAKYVIRKNGKRFVATAMYREFVQTTYQGEPNAMWTRMPCNQLAKCAEVQAWKKVYPNDFAGLVHEDAAQPIDGDTTEPMPRQRPKDAAVTADEILTPRVDAALAKARAKQAKPTPEPDDDDLGIDLPAIEDSDRADEIDRSNETDDEPALIPVPSGTNKTWTDFINSILASVNADKPSDVDAVVDKILGEDKAGATLTLKQLKTVYDTLLAWRGLGTLEQMVTDAILAADVRTAD